MTFENEEILQKFKIHPEMFKIPVTQIQKIDKKIVEKTDKQLSEFLLTFFTKDGRFFSVEIDQTLTNESSKILFIFEKCVYIEKIQDFYAFTLAKFQKNLDEEYQGWKIYNIKEEFNRQKAGIKQENQNDADQNVKIN